MILLRDETAFDVPARERLLDACFGPARLAKTSQRLRDGRLPAQGLSLSAEADGRLIGTVRLWHVAAGDRAALLLGPLAVDPASRACGLGAGLMREAVARAEALGHGAVLLVGDAPYYARFGFGPAPAALAMPGPFERDRFLALELRAGALAEAAGPLRAAGALAPSPGVEAAAGVARRRAA